MNTKYNTGDEVLIPVIVKYAMTAGGDVAYAMQDLKDENGADILVFEGMIEGKAKIGKERFYKERWDKIHKEIAEAEA